MIKPVRPNSACAVRIGKGEPCRHAPRHLPGGRSRAFAGRRSSPGEDTELLVSPGKLSRVHAGLVRASRIAPLCHTEKKKVDPGKCLACHKDLAARIRAGRGLHKKWADSCLPCHPEHQGEDFRLIEWDLKKFSHGETGFPLTGLHKKIANCVGLPCHGQRPDPENGKNLLLRDTGCAACQPDPHRGRAGSFLRPMPCRRRPVQAGRL